MGPEEEVEAALGRATAALGGEARPGQVAMARAVARAITGRRHLVVQAGTGTGKSLAYLVPLVALGARAVVATATKALQDQLAGKDLPHLARHLGRPFRFAVLKGRSNYLCLQKATELGQTQLDLAGLDPARDADELVRILDWAKTSPTGDRADLDREPSGRAWASLSAGSDECPGAARCPMGEACFAEAARRRAAEADVVVVNTHLYGVHLAAGGTVLPEHDVVVFDEAHALEDVAAATLGLELGARRFAVLARALRGLLGGDGAAAVAAAVEDAGTRLDAALAPALGQRLAGAAWESAGTTLAAAARAVDQALRAARAADPPGESPASARRQRVLKLASSLTDALAAARELSEDEVAWVEGPVEAPVLRVAPVEVGPRLAPLWAERVGVLTSATLPPGLTARVGLPPQGTDTLDAGTPFDYRAQSLLYVARHLPDPRDPGYESPMLAELEALVRAAGGRTLALFTSWRAMRAAAEALAPVLPWRVLTQAELPKPALLRAFTADEASCLFATMGFWQGVDVPGAALSLVVIDRLPFARPDDPLTQARRERAGRDAFAAVDLPRAATLLAQGAGRLIRSASDRGVVAVLDRRLALAGYRGALLAALPPMRRTVERAEVERFLAAARPEAGASPVAGG